jgi:uncharacterized linocin/CFP29 family protein
MDHPSEEEGKKGNYYIFITHDKYVRFVYFISDMPHLIKTVRNCWLHSTFSGARLLTVSKGI